MAPATVRTFPDPSATGEARDKAGERMHVCGRTVEAYTKQAKNVEAERFQALARE